MQLTKLLARRASQVAGTVRTYRAPLVRAMEFFGFTAQPLRRIVHLRNGLAFWVRMGTSDFGVLDDVFMRGVYNQALQHINAGDVVIDIGAQCGAFAIAAARRGARVFCYEPLSANVDLLQANVRLNGCEAWITVEESAVAATPDHKMLYVMRADTGGATFFPSIHPDWAGSAGVSQLSVRCVTLGDVFSTHGIEQCDCLKMDCEGAEYEIFGTADPRDLRRTQMIVLEYHPNGDVGAISDRLRESGFVVRVILDPCVLLARRSG